MLASTFLRTAGFAKHRMSAPSHSTLHQFTNRFLVQSKSSSPAQGASLVRWTTTHTKAPVTSDNNDQESSSKSKPCCASKKQATANTSRPKSSLPISSLQFWSDPTTWKVASVNTFRCLIGCTAGDMSMLFYLQSQHPDMSPGLVMAAAMTSGVLTSITLETVLLRFSRASAMSWRAAFKTATGMSLISMLTMEAVENAVDWHLMGWGNIDIHNPLFWQAIGWSALAGWSAPLPFNYWNLKRHGKSCH
ncbi:hypothetical protein BGZ94_001911 [Podila epigama]|nr:hypothetical protein BGZ94_001911 [Podila epigama]